VFEARDRVGGRCHTVDGVDLGAHWIHGTEDNPVTALARRLGLPTVFVGGDSTFTGGWDALEVRRAGAVGWADGDKLAGPLRHHALDVDPPTPLAIHAGASADPSFGAPCDKNQLGLLRLRMSRRHPRPYRRSIQKIGPVRSLPTSV
jgi:hypothetical protein